MHAFSSAMCRKRKPILPFLCAPKRKDHCKKKGHQLPTCDYLTNNTSPYFILVPDILHRLVSAAEATASVGTAGGRTAAGRGRLVSAASSGRRGLAITAGGSGGPALARCGGGRCRVGGGSGAAGTTHVRRNVARTLRKGCLCGGDTLVGWGCGGRCSSRFGLRCGRGRSG